VENVCGVLEDTVVKGVPSSPQAPFMTNQVCRYNRALHGKTSDSTKDSISYDEDCLA
jgi:hypothetical protein